MQEKWKDIKGYEGCYQVSNLGRVRSLTRKVKTFNGYRTTQGKILKPLKTNRNYYRVDLKQNQKNKYVSIHRLVAEAFIPNPNNYSVVNHIDCDTSNNRAENLEWCTQSYNIKEAFRLGTAKPYRHHYINGSLPCTPIKVKQFSLQNIFIKEYSSIKEASLQTKTSSKGISLCCRKLQKTANNYIWRYAD
jgi:hypothetical protein